jgi:hypothetical protein
MSARGWLLKIRSYVAWQAKRAVRAPFNLVNVLLGTAWYDLVLARKRRVYRGAVPESTRVAVYLIYPVHGLLESHVKALAHFLEHGYAPIVVSNVPLNLGDRERLLACVHTLIERPNYGYDFGGYRDGLLFLSDRLHALDRLVLMNDSVWFPVASCPHWLPAAEASELDVVGAVANCFNDPAGMRADASGALSWHYDVGHPRFHYCSFALSFGPAVLHDPRFPGFWKRLKLSNDKYVTIQRGEVGLGQWIVQSGHSHGCTLDVSQLDADLDRLTDERLQMIATSLVIPEDRGLRQRKAALLAQGMHAPGSRLRVRNFILQATAETGPAYALLEFALRDKGHGFVKKSPLWLEPEGAEVTLKLLSELGEQTFHEEACALARPRGCGVEAKAP